MIVKHKLYPGDPTINSFHQYENEYLELILR